MERCEESAGRRFGHEGEYSLWARGKIERVGLRDVAGTGTRSFGERDDCPRMITISLYRLNYVEPRGIELQEQAAQRVVPRFRAAKEVCGSEIREGQGAEPSISEMRASSQTLPHRKSSLPDPDGSNWVRSGLHPCHHPNPCFEREELSRDECLPILLEQTGDCLPGAARDVLGQAQRTRQHSLLRLRRHCPLLTSLI